MNLYVLGHGYYLCDDHLRANVPLAIPAGISVRFYCKEQSLFDSAWEKPIMENGAAVGAAFPRLTSRTGAIIEPGKNDWKVEEAKGNYQDYLLTRPGKITPYKALDAMKEMLPDSDGTAVSVPPCEESDTLYIRSKEHSSCRLSALLKVLHERGFQGTLHWLACRFPLPNYPNLSPDDRDVVRDVFDQAKELIGGEPLPQQKPKVPFHHGSPAARLNTPKAGPLDAALDFASSYPSIEERGVT